VFGINILGGFRFSERQQAVGSNGAHVDIWNFATNWGWAMVKWQGGIVNENAQVVEWGKL
jgi:hypothetical protein